jgi:hypothetical protein
MDLLLTPSEHVFRSDVVDDAIRADVVVMLDVALHQMPRIVQRQWRSWPDALSFEGFVPALNFSVRLGIVGSSSDVGHARYTNEFLEVLGNELRAVAGDDAWLRLRMKFLGVLQDDLDVRLAHRLP